MKIRQWHDCLSCIKGVYTWKSSLYIETNHESPMFLLWDTLIINPLTHWGRVTHICISKLTIIGSDNGLSPERRQAIIWTNAGLLLIGPLGTNFIEILIGIQTFSFKKMHLKMSSAKQRPFCLGLNVLSVSPVYTWDPHPIITVPADVLATHGARPSAGTMITAQLNIFSTKFLWIEVISNYHF